MSSMSGEFVFLVDYDNSCQKFANFTIDDKSYYCYRPDIEVILFVRNDFDTSTGPKERERGWCTVGYKRTLTNAPEAADVCITCHCMAIFEDIYRSNKIVYIVAGSDAGYGELKAQLEHRWKERSGSSSEKCRFRFINGKEKTLLDSFPPNRSCSYCDILFKSDHDCKAHCQQYGRPYSCAHCKEEFTCEKEMEDEKEEHQFVYYKLCKAAGCSYRFPGCTEKPCKTQHKRCECCDPPQACFDASALRLHEAQVQTRREEEARRKLYPLCPYCNKEVGARNLEKHKKTKCPYRPELVPPVQPMSFSFFGR